MSRNCHRQTIKYTCVQKRCLKLLFPALSYTESLRKSGLEPLNV